MATFRATREQQNKGAISAPSRKLGKLLVARRNQALNIASRTMSRLWNETKLVPLEMMIMVWTNLLLLCAGHQTGLHENRRGINQSPPNNKPGGR